MLDCRVQDVFFATKNLLNLDETKLILIPSVSMEQEKKEYNPKGGRPRKVEEDKTTYSRIMINFSKKEREKFDELHKKHGGTQNDFIKNCIFQPKNLYRKNVDYKKLIFEINKIGVNINQIAFELNRDKNLQRIVDNENKINKVLETLNEVYKKLN
jgi:hypothetical protein